MKIVRYLPRVLGVLFLTSVALVACSSSKADSSECCPLPAALSQCRMDYGGSRASLGGSCIRGNEGHMPDVNAPGWVVRDDANGCPEWVPPANARLVDCGNYVQDAGRPDAASDAASDAAPDRAGD